MKSGSHATEQCTVYCTVPARMTVSSIMICKVALLSSCSVMLNLQSLNTLDRPFSSLNTLDRRPCSSSNTLDRPCSSFVSPHSLRKMGRKYEVVGSLPRCRVVPSSRKLCVFNLRRHVTAVIVVASNDVEFKIWALQMWMREHILFVLRVHKRFL